MTEAIFEFTPGEAPLLVSCPHVGTFVPADILARFTDAGRLLADTDWSVDRLYADAAARLGLPMLTATHSRYVVDLNRDPAGSALYAGADNTELCPTTTFAHEPIYVAGGAPGGDEIARRVEAYWRPYHAKLAESLDAMHARHGVAVLIEGHSIRSHVPRFFDGKLPDFNLGTAAGASADGDLAARVFGVLHEAGGFTAVQDGRFKGGYITRHHGRPADDRHALQLEKAQAIYMDEDPPFAYRPDRAAAVEIVIRRMLEVALEWAAETSARGTDS